MSIRENFFSPSSVKVAALTPMLPRERKADVKRSADSAVT